MSHRWLAGVLIFTLGFGSACLVKVATAAYPEEGEVEAGLDYVNAAEFKLVNWGDQNYVVVVVRKPGIPPAEPQVSYKEGSAVFSKNGLESLRIYRLTPVGELKDIFRPCNPDFTDCPLPRPLPPPPPPTATFLRYPGAG